MIVKNEEDNLDRCLKSIQGIPDEIIIVDTGSTDSTVEIAKKYTSKIYFYEWNDDFSAARNFSISKASGDWILLLDADDEIDDKYKEQIKELTEDTSVHLYCFKTLSFLNENDIENVNININPRLFQNKPGYRFKGKIHEQLLIVIKEINPDAVVKVLPIEIYHYGYLDTNVKNKHKTERNMKLIQKQLEEEPENPIFNFTMGNEYYSLKNIKEAYNYYLKAHKNVNHKNSVYPILILNMLFCCKSLKAYDDFYKYAEEALKHYPTFADIYYLRGYLNYSLGKTFTAVDDLNKALLIGEPHAALNFIKGSGTYKATKLLCKIYYDNMDYEKCAYYCSKFIEYPEVKDFDPVKILVDCLYKLKASRENIKKTIEIFLSGTKKKSLMYFAILLIAEKDYDLALEYINKGLEDLKYKIINEMLRKDLINNFEYLKGICEFHKKDYKNCILTLTKINNKKLDHKISPYLFLCGLLSENHKLIKLSLCNDNHEAKVCSSLYDILNAKECKILSTDNKESLKYENIIFTILESLLIIEEYSKFEKALALLDLINSSNIHLRLGKLYYKYNKYELSKKELMLSISLNNIIDEEGSRILYNLCIKEPQ